MTTGHWCQANIGLLMANIDESIIFSMDGCSKPTSIPYPAPVNNSLLCFNDGIANSFQNYTCFCDLRKTRCTTYFNKEMIAEARRQYHADFDPPTTTPEPTTTRTTEKPVTTSAASNSSKTNGEEWSSTMASTTNNSLLLGGMAALFVILICVLLVFGVTFAWKRKKARSNDSRDFYGPFGLLRLNFAFLCNRWSSFDFPTTDNTCGSHQDANSRDIAEGQEFIDHFQAKNNTRNAIVRGTALECKDDNGKKLHANYLNKEKTIIAALNPDPTTAAEDGPYFGSFVKMITAKQPAVIVNLGFFNEPTANILGEFPNCPNQNVREQRRCIGNGRLDFEDTYVTRRRLRFADVSKETKKETFHACEHITYNAWPEGGSATETDCLTLLAAYVFEKYVSQNKLVVLTSEHGCGRTGTFALALLLLKEAASRELTSKDVLRIAVEIRRSRYTAIYGPMQFGFGITLALSVHAKHLRDKELRKKSSQLFMDCQAGAMLGTGNALLPSDSGRAIPADVKDNNELKTLTRKLLKHEKNENYPFELSGIRSLIKRAKHEFATECSLAEVKLPVVVVGDIHGQFHDLLRIFALFEEKKGGEMVDGCFSRSFLFLGDYVDRGPQQLECIVLLLALKLLRPESFTLLRGNHESADINKRYGFLAELTERFQKNDAKLLFSEVNDLFAYLPVACLVSDQILCMHGGLSPHLTTLDDIRALKKPVDLDKSRLATDLLWADPMIGLKGFKPNEVRGVGVYFGEDVAAGILKKLQLKFIIRAHQMMNDGVGFFCNRMVITVFSAPGYNSKKNSSAAVLEFFSNGKYGIKIIAARKGSDAFRGEAEADMSHRDDGGIHRLDDTVRE